MSDDVPVTDSTIAAWLRATIDGDNAALQCIASTSNPGELLMGLTRVILELAHDAYGLDVLEKAITRWHRQQLGG